MTPHDFLRAVWPDDGIYCVAYPYIPEGSDKPVYRQITRDNIEAIVTLVEQSRDTRDWFFCVHSLKDHSFLNPVTEKRQVRVHANMREAKCFFFDLDVGAGDKKYATQADAVKALRAFCEELKLPRPLVVSSGGGVHVYWLITESIPSQEWKGYAALLRKLAERHGLKADPARTTDMSSVLRIVGTFNHKRAEPRPVKVIVPGQHVPTGEMLKILTDAAGEAPMLATPADLPWQDNLTKAQEFGPPPTLEKLVESCAQIARMVELKGDVPNPEWIQLVNVVRFTERGRENCHDVSRGFDGYAAEEVDRLIDRFEAQKLGPTTCDKMSEACGPDLCRVCPNAAAGKSPLAVARKRMESLPPPRIISPTDPARVVVCELPFPFVTAKDGVVHRVKTAVGDPKDTLILPRIKLYPLARQSNDMEKREQQLWEAELPRGEIIQFEVNAEALYDAQATARTLSNVGIYPPPSCIRLVQDYMTSYIRELQRLQEAEKQNNHLGWVSERQNFLLPNKLITATGVKPATMSSTVKSAVDCIRTKGSLQRQVDLLQFYNDPFYLPQQFIMMCSLAAPLFHATGQNGVTVNAYGETGASKSSSLYAGAAFWGSPKEYVINGTNRGATYNERHLRMDVLANLPVCIDELTHIPVDEAKDMVMTVTQPTGRTGLTRDRKLRKGTGADKATIMMSSSNASLHGILSRDSAAGSASAMRVLEVPCKKDKIRYGEHGLPHSSFEAEEFMFQLEQNYGWIGPAFIEEVVRNHESYVSRVREVMRHIEISAHMHSGERFYKDAIACVTVATEIANKLGLVPFNAVRLLNWALTSLVPYTRGVVREEYATPLSVLTDYIAKIHENILVVSKVKSAMGDKWTPIHDARGSLLGRYERDTGLLYLLLAAFKTDCSRSGANSSQIIRDLSTVDGTGNRIVTNPKYRATLGKGFDAYDKGQSWCFVVNMNHPDLKTDGAKPSHLRAVS